MALSCNICCEPYNSNARKLVKCPVTNCSFEVCKTCVRRYLLNTTEDPHCMKCHSRWSQNFVVINLNRSFISNDYKTHRKELLLEIEMSKLLATMPSVERLKLINQEETRISEINDEISKLSITICTLKKELSERNRKILQHKKINPVTKNKFIMQCPAENCRGFLSTQYVCGMCNLRTCSKCFEIVNPGGAEQHICNQDSIKSAEMIKQETKPCPSCGVRIFKVSGCDQMWCTECHKAFSWKHGTIQKGAIHNPHYFEYQMKNKSNIPRNENDLICGGLCSWHDLRRFVLQKLSSLKQILSEEECHYYSQTIINIFRFSVEIQELFIPNIRDKIATLEDNESIRVLYILKQKSKEEMSSGVYKKDTARKKYTEIIELYQLMNTTSIEQFISLVQSNEYGIKFVDEVKNEIDQFINLCDYCSEQFDSISITYNQVTPRIDYFMHGGCICFKITEKKSDNYLKLKNKVHA